MITRDSLILIIGIVASIFGYLVTAEVPPTAWSYMQWLQFGTYLTGIVLAWLRSSPLAGTSTPLRDSTTTLFGTLKVYDKKE